MMHCDEAKQRWHEQLDEGGRDGPLAEHVARCVSCAQYAAQMETVLCGLDELGIQSELDIAVGASDGRAARYGRRWRWFRPLAVGRAAAVIALCFGAYSWMEPGGGRQSIESGAGRSDVGTVDGVTHGDTKMPGRIAWPEATNLGVTLRGKSATRFLAVDQPTMSPDVLMIRLYETGVAGHPGVD